MGLVGNIEGCILIIDWLILGQQVVTYIDISVEGRHKVFHDLYVERGHLSVLEILNMGKVYFT